MKRTLALLLASFLLLALFAGCGKQPVTTPDTSTPSDTSTPPESNDQATDTTDDPQPAATGQVEPTQTEIPEGGNASEFTAFDTTYFQRDELKTLSFWKAYSNVNTNNDINHHSIVQWMEDKTNVHINFETVSTNDAATKFNLMVTSGALCDIMSSFSSYYPSTTTYAAEEGLIYDLTDVVPEYMPNYHALLLSSEQAQRECKTDDGRMPVVWTLGSDWGTPAAEPIWYGLAYREDWANEQGFGDLVTIEDWHAYLTACKSNYATCDAALSLTTNVWDMMGSFMTAYDTYPGFYVRDGKVGYGPLDSGYRDAVQNMANWFAEGLIDPDFAANAFMGNTDKLYQDQVAALATIWGLTGTQALDAGQVTNKNWNLKPAVAPVLNEGDTPKTSYSLRCIIKECTAISADVADIELAARWLDQWYCYETMVRQFGGIEGETYYIDETGYHYMEGVGIYESSAIHLYDYGMGTAAWGLYDFHNFDMSNTATNAHASVHVWDRASTDEILPNGMTLNAKESEEYSPLYNDITTYVNENVAKFVMGLTPMSEYDTFIKNLTSSYGTLRCIEIQHAAYDRFMAR